MPYPKGEGHVNMPIMTLIRVRSAQFKNYLNLGEDKFWLLINNHHAGFARRLLHEAKHLVRMFSGNIVLKINSFILILHFRPNLMGEGLEHPFAMQNGHIPINTKMS